jgi:hypothetical protein
MRSAGFDLVGPRSLAPPLDSWQGLSLDEVSRVTVDEVSRVTIDEVSN